MITDMFSAGTWKPRGNGWVYFHPDYSTYDDRARLEARMPPPPPGKHGTRVEIYPSGYTGVLQWKIRRLGLVLLRETWEKAVQEAVRPFMQYTSDLEELHPLWYTKEWVPLPEPEAEKTQCP